MPATEIFTTVVGKSAGKDVHKPTGQSGQTFPSVFDWVAGKKKAGIDVQEVTSTVLVMGATEIGHDWAAYTEIAQGKTLLTIFEITRN